MLVLKSARGELIEPSSFWCRPARTPFSPAPAIFWSRGRQRPMWMTCACCWSIQC